MSEANIQNIFFFFLEIHEEWDRVENPLIEWNKPLKRISEKQEGTT
jgi:hypothetical protein